MMITTGRHSCSVLFCFIFAFFSLQFVFWPKYLCLLVKSNFKANKRRDWLQNINFILLIYSWMGAWVCYIVCMCVCVSEWLEIWIQSGFNCLNLILYYCAEQCRAFIYECIEQCELTELWFGFFLLVFQCIETKISQEFWPEQNPIEVGWSV